MEIQGLSDAPNTQSQHGALPRPASSPPQSEHRLLSARTDSDGPLGPPEPQSDNNNNDAGPKTSPFRLLEENGCSAATVSNTQPAVNGSRGAFLGLHNLTADKDNELDSLLVPHEFSRTGWRHEDSGDMALPLSGGEEESTAEQQLAAPPPAVGQQPPVGSRGAAAPRDWNSVSKSDQRSSDRFVRFSTLREDGRSCEHGRSEMKAEGPECSKASPFYLTEGSKESSSIPTERSKASSFFSTERSKESSSIPTERSKASSFFSTERSKESSFGPGEVVSIPFGSSADSLAFPHTRTQRAQPIFSLITDGSALIHAKQNNHHTVEDVFLTNKYGDQICGQVCTDTSDGKLFRDLSRIDESIALISEMEAVEKSEYSTNSRTLVDSTNSVPAASETFSGTITINNQSIIVTIENGILTLAAPPEGHVHKEDDMISLKEHLGMKDHEDIVLLNYDGGTKSIGKISTLMVASPNQHEEPRPALSVSDSELTLADDNSLSELSASFDSCPIVKQESGALCTVTEVGLVTALPNSSTADCDIEDMSSLPLIRSKKDTVASFGCPEPGCPCTFESRQKLKVHLLNHAEDPRPYQCTVEGCGWAFATSYKLKRHIQSHDKQRPHICQFEGCGRRFTTVYNLKAHVKVHEQDDAFTCEICNEKFRSATRLTNHQRVHFEPQRPHKCEFPGCEKTFITFSALFSHNRTHFRETGHFACTYPGCDKAYDKACRLKIHTRSHTGERPFVCDSEGCGWSFTSMSKLLRHKRKHDDDRRFICTEEGCGKSFTRAEHLKGHSITHLGTKPFQCHAEGCNAKFSARSSLYIHSKKHKQDGSSLRTRCPVASCSKHFSSRSSLKSHILKHHHLSPDVLSQMETTPTLTPSSELISSTPTSVAGPGVVGGDQLNLDLSSLFSPVPGVTAPTGVGIPVTGSASNGSFTMDLSLVSSGILTIDPSSGGTTLVTSTNATLAKALDPLIMATSSDMAHQHGLEGTVGDVLPPQGTLNLDDVQRVTPEALGTLTALTLQGAAASVDPTLQHPLSSSSSLNVETAASLAVAPAAELLASPSKGVEVAPQGGAGSLLGCVEVMTPQEGGKVLTQFVFPSHSSCFSPQKDLEPAVSPSSFLESGGSARTDYRAIQMAKKRKQRGSSGTSCQRNTKASRVAMAILPPRYGDGAVAGGGGLTLRDPVTGAQYVQIQLLQDDPAGDGDLAFQLSSQPSSSHSQLTVDLPVNILQQEPSMMTEEDNGSDNSQFTGSTINLQDLE